MSTWKQRSLLTLLDYTPDEIQFLLQTAHTVKAQAPRNRFHGLSMAMLFEKTSTRTRLAAETAFGEEGGNPIFLSKKDLQLDTKETLKDTARVFAVMADVILFRGFEQQTVETLAKYADIPVINGLTDAFHPTQALADLMTMQEHEENLAGKTSIFIGDGRNNVSHSMAIAAAAVGIEHHIICPPALKPSDSLLQSIQEKYNTRTIVSHNPADIPRNAFAIYTDVWTSMGEEAAAEERLAMLTPFRVTETLMQKIPEAVFMHCLPARRGEEVEAAVLDGKHSVVWKQAENRKHIMKAILLAIFDKI